MIPNPPRITELRRRQAIDILEGVPRENRGTRRYIRGKRMCPLTALARSIEPFVYSSTLPKNKDYPTEEENELMRHIDEVVEEYFLLNSDRVVGLVDYGSWEKLIRDLKNG